MAVYYVRFGGPLPGGEVWNTGVHLQGSSSVDSVALVGADMAAELWGAGGGAPIGALYPSSIQLTSVVAYDLDLGTGKAQARGEEGVSHVGTNVGVPLPQEVAVCATLRTALPGPAGRGRMYLPGPAVTEVEATGRLDAATAQAFADQVAAALSIAVAAGLTPVLYSFGRPEREITLVDVGDVFDAQRRRRDKLVEARYSATP